MSYSDSFSDSITRIRNGQMAKLLEVNLVYSKLCLAFLKILKEEGYISDYAETLITNKKGFSYKSLKVFLKYSSSGAAIKEIVRFSKPGCRMYSSAKKIGGFRGGLGVMVLSTSSGVLTDRMARKLGVGGEWLCGVF